MFARALTDPEVIARFENSGGRVLRLSPAETEALVKRDTDRWSRADPPGRRARRIVFLNPLYKEHAMDPVMLQRLDIAQVVQNWALWRDAGDWDRFRTVWASDGYMSATWFQGSASEFIKVSKEGFEKGVSILHFLGGCSVDLQGQPRAIAANQDDHQPARYARWRRGRRGLHRALLRLFRGT